jgi:triacylglycerol lipase
MRLCLIASLGLALSAGCELASAAEPLASTAPRRDRTGTPPLFSARPPLDGTVYPENDGVPAPVGPPWPVILVHGFSGWMDFGSVEYFYNVADDLRAAGADVTVPNLPPYDSSEERARVLGRVVDDVVMRTNAQKVHLIAHSQGGIDSRVLLTDLGYADRIASLTTISTPHRGTRIADLAGSAPDGLLNPAGQLLGWLVGSLEGEPPSEAAWLADESVQAAYDPDLAAAITSLSTTTMATFNENHPDPEGVPVFSVAGVTNLLSLAHPECDGGQWERSDRVDVVDAFFAASGLYLSSTDGGDLFDPTPNDGLVTVAAARRGTFLGCIPADHADEIGHILDGGNLVSGFDHRRFYLRLLEHVRSVERDLAP